MNNALATYLDEINFKRSLFGEGPLDIYEDYNYLSDRLYSLGSPEILSKDGELSIEEHQARFDFWMEAVEELSQLVLGDPDYYEYDEVTV